MHYGFINKDFPLFINGHELKSTESERDLEVIASKNLMSKKQTRHFMREQSKSNNRYG